MHFDPVSAHKAAATPVLGRPTRHVVLLSAAFAAALLTLFLSGALFGQRSGTVAASTPIQATPSLAPPPDNMSWSPSSDRGHAARFFGFLEFDWDPGVPGGVPGFDPWPGTQQQD